jgi:predicted AAA+ superfamily ATPase
MQWLQRYYEIAPNVFFKAGKVIILYGARRVGKTMLMKRLLASRTGRIFSATGEDMELASILTSRKIETYRLFFGPYDIIFIDEAQYIDNVGECLKMLVDLFQDKYFIITGSSAFNISQSASEPLTGRSIVKALFPIGLVELLLQFEPFDIYKNFESYLLYGMYPEIFSLPSVQEKIEYLINLRNGYLFKDIFALEQVKNSQKLQDIARLLALQIGNEVSLNEIATKVGLSKNTVERYIDLLEKAFVIKKVSAFSRNLRNEISKSAKYYFWDTGVRNAVINNFNRLDMRSDVGALWENFVVMEFIKKHEYAGDFAQFYFWRTYDQKELDLVIEKEGTLTGYEIKWQNPKAKIPALWLETYSGRAEVVTQDRLLGLL